MHNLKLARISFIVALSTALTACYSMQKLNDESAIQYHQSIAQFKSKGLLDTSSSIAKRIKTIFNNMKPYAEAENKSGQPYNWEVNVVKSKELNAFAMAGGKIIFYNGIVDRLNLNNNEIAAIMGHEMSHVLLEHSWKQNSMEMWTSVIVDPVKKALGEQYGQIGADLGDLVVGGAVDLAVSKPYSRSAESDADALGMMIMAKAGYNPANAVTLWQKMAKANAAKSGTLDRLLSTHPLDKDREEALQKQLPEALKLYQQAKKH